MSAYCDAALGIGTLFFVLFLVFIFIALAIYVALKIVEKTAVSIAETLDEQTLDEQKKEEKKRIKQMNLAGEKVTESKKELIPKIEGVEESKEELIAKLDKRLIDGEISEETYKHIIDRIKSMSEANKSKERGMEPKTEVE